MADSKVEIVISAKDNASAVLKKVGGSATDLGKTLAIGIAGGAAALAAGLAGAATAAAGFEQKMSGVRAVSGASAQEMAQLSALALKLGKDTSFSASEAARGLEELVKGGVSIPDIMNGAAQATLNLAAAGGVDLASAAEIASNALNAFNLSGSDMAHVADLIAGAANASAIDVGDFRLSLAAAGAVTATVGGSFDDLAVAIAAMGNAGIKGSDAGTSLKTMLLGLQPVTDKQKSLMRELGLVTAAGSNQFFDAQGHIKSFADVSQVLQDALKGQTDQQKLATLETLFGSDAIRAASVFTKLGAEGFNTLAGSMAKVTAESVAATRLDNLAGDIEQLKGSAETAAITLGQALQPALRDAVQGMTKFINEGVIPFVQEHGPKIAQVASDAVKGIADFAAGVKSAADQGLNDFGTKLDDIGRQWAPWAAGAGKAGDAVGLALSGVHGAAVTLQLLLRGDFAGAMDAAQKALDNFGGAADMAGQALQEKLQPALEHIESAANRVVSALQAVGTEAANQGAVEKMGRAHDEAAMAGDRLHRSFENLLVVFGMEAGAAAKVADGFNLGNYFTGIWAGTLNTIAGVVEHVAQNVNAAAGIFQEYTNTLKSVVQGIPGAVENAVIAAQAIVDAVALVLTGGRFTAGEAIQAIGKTINDTLAGLAAGAGAVASTIGVAIVDGIRNGIAGKIGEVANAASSLVTSALNAARTAADAHSPSRVAMVIGVDIAEGLAVGIEDAASLAGDAATEMVDDAISVMDDMAPEAQAAGYSFGQALSDGLAAGLGKIKTLEGTADPLRGSVAGAMRDLGGQIDSLRGQMESRIDGIRERAGQAWSEATQQTARAIQDAIQNTEDRLAEMSSNIDLNHVIRARRQVFDAQISGEDLAHQRAEDVADLERSRTKEDADIAYRLARDLAKAKTKEDVAQINERAAEAAHDLQRRRASEDDDRDYRRKKEDADRAYRMGQDLKRQAFEDVLEEEALQRQIRRSEEERDKRISSLNQALDDKRKKIDDDLQRETKQAREAFSQRVSDLRDVFVSQLPALTGEAQSVVSAFLDAIAAQIDSIAAKAASAASAIGGIHGPSGGGGGGGGGSHGGGGGGGSDSGTHAGIDNGGNVIQIDKPYGDMSDAEKDAANRFAREMGNVGSPSFEVPMMAAGGIVRRPMLAMIGESGPEAVVPLSQLNGGGIDYDRLGEAVARALRMNPPVMAVDSIISGLAARSLNGAQVLS